MCDREVTKVGAEKQVSWWDNGPKQGEGLRCQGLRAFEVKLREFCVHSIRKKVLQLVRSYRPPIVEAAYPPQQHGHHAAAVGKDELDLGQAALGFCFPKTEDCSSRVGRELHPCGRKRRLLVGKRFGGAARCFSRMDVDDGLAAVELFKDRLELSVAQPGPAILGRDAKSVSLQNIKSVGDFGQRALDAVERQGGEKAEPSGMIGPLPAAPLVGLPGSLCLFLGIRPEDGSGVGDGGGDAVAVKLVERHLDGPEVSILVFACGFKVVVDVDKPRRRRRCSGPGERGERERRRAGSRATKKLAAAAGMELARLRVHGSFHLDSSGRSIIRLLGYRSSVVNSSIRCL